MTSPSELAVDHQMAAEDDEDTLERMPDPASSLLTENPQPVAPVAAWDPAAAVSAAASQSTSWHDIQVTFVDDPRSAVEMAAGLVDDSSQALVAFVKEQQDSLQAAWHGEDAGTEELRVALQHYRAFGTRLADFSRET